MAVALAAANTHWWSVDEFDLYQGNCSASSRGLALSRAGWSASSNAHPSSTDAPANALDGNSSTRFSTDVPQAPGLFFEVDLGSKQSFDELAMESPSSPNDYARGYYIEVSDDASSWTIVANCTGTSSPEVVRFAPQTARYVAVALAAANSHWWSVDEFDLYTQTGVAPAITERAEPCPPRRRICRLHHYRLGLAGAGSQRVRHTATRPLLPGHHRRHGHDLRYPSCGHERHLRRGHLRKQRHRQPGRPAPGHHAQ